jgi:cytochrome c oxidase subunit 2
VSKAIAGLLFLAAGLLALSFVNWDGAGAARAEAGAPVPMTVPPTPTATPADRGRALFLSRGCASCHRHDGLNIERVSVAGDGVLVGIIDAPDLTRYQPNPDFVRRWLRDPQTARPGTIMPDLNLSGDEVEALLAFLQTNTPK